MARLGGLAFAPRTPEVEAFARYIAASHHFFGSVFAGVFDTEVGAARDDCYAL